MKTIICYIFGALFALSALLAPQTSSAATLALYSDVNSFSSGTSARNQLLTNLLGDGTNVIVSKKNSSFPISPQISSFFTGLTGVTSSLTSGAISGALLSGIDLLFLNVGCCIGSSNPYDAGETASISSFLDSGGTVGLLAEPCCGVTPVSMNQFLTDLGSSMTLQDPSSSSGTAIMSSPFGAGVTGFAINTLNPISGGTAIATLSNGQVAAAYEDFDVMAPVPVPAGGLLLLSGLGGVVALKRRKKRAA